MPTSNLKRTGQKRIPTDDEKLLAVSLLYNRLNRGFTLYRWFMEIRPMLAVHPRFSEEHFAVTTIQNACVESALMSVRDLDDFFRPRTKQTRDNDLRATDFDGYQSPGLFLSGPERESINQRIAHLTYEPVWTGTTGIAPDSQFDWNTTNLVGKAARAVLGFLSYVESELLSKQPDKAGDIRKVIRTFELMLKNMEALAKLQNEHFVNTHKDMPHQS